MSISDLFKDPAKVFKVRRLVTPPEVGQEYDAVRVEQKIVKGRFPDRPSFKEVERDIVDPKTKEVVQRVKDRAKCFDFEAGDCHGGMFSAEVGDYILQEVDTYFVVPDVDRRSRKIIFAARYVRI